MYDKHRNNAGVLNDFDLATFAKQPSPSSSERTGTIPFMALELIHPSHPPGSVKHEYRHDHESFAWTLLWIFGTFKDGQEVSKRPSRFERWVTADSYEAKYATLGDLKIIAVTETFQQYWPRLKKMLEDVRDRLVTGDIHTDRKRRKFLRSRKFQRQLYDTFLSYAYAPLIDDHDHDDDSSSSSSDDASDDASSSGSDDSDDSSGSDSDEGDDDDDGLPVPVHVHV